MAYKGMSAVKKRYMSRLFGHGDIVDVPYISQSKVPAVVLVSERQ